MNLNSNKVSFTHISLQHFQKNTVMKRIPQFVIHYRTLKCIKK